MAGEVDPKGFARELLRAARRTPAAAEKVVRRNSNDVKKQSRRNVQMTAPRHNAHAQKTIGYDVEVKGDLVEGEIGYEKGKPGAGLGNLLEFGGGGDHSPPHNDLARALDGQVTLFMDDLADMGEALIAGAVEAVLARMNVDEVAE